MQMSAKLENQADSLAHPNYWIILFVICLLLSACFSGSNNSLDRDKVTETVSMYKTYLHDTPEGPDLRLHEELKSLNAAEAELWIEEAYKMHMALTLEDLESRPLLPEHEKTEQKALITDMYDLMRMSNTLSLKLMGKSFNNLSEEENAIFETKIEELKREGKLSAEFVEKWELFD